jgi:hypothetical protein
VTPRPVGGSIHLSPQASSGLRPGETVTVHVIKKLDAGKWAVGVQGWVYPASSDLPLEAGAVLKARVSGSAGRLVLTVSDNAPDALRAALSLQGIPRGGPEEVIARALARAGLPVMPEIIQKVKMLLSRAGMDPRKSSRSAIAMIEKRIDPASPGALTLLKVLELGQKGGEDPRRYRGRPLPESPRAVKEILGSLSVPPRAALSALPAFNHAAARNPSWIVVPFVFTSGEHRLSGTLKILFDVFRNRPLALAISTDEVALHMTLQGARCALSVYCDTEPLKKAAAAGLDSLRAKFHNMGLEVDDIIKEGTAFDGFSAVEEGESLPSVDTVG